MYGCIQDMYFCVDQKSKMAGTCRALSETQTTLVLIFLFKNCTFNITLKYIYNGAGVGTQTKGESSSSWGKIGSCGW